jgi:hypothetical protein
MGGMRLLQAAAAAAWLALFSVPALADGDPASLYDVSTTGSTAQVKMGQTGKWVLAIQPKAGAHVSDDAPLKIELSGKHVKVEKDKLARKDAVAAGPSPRFEVPFSPESPGQGSIDAKVTFFICTDKICSRQQKAITLPVDVL